MLSRPEVLVYVFNYFLYVVVVAAPLVGFVFGTYLWLSLNWLSMHYNEGFSSLHVTSFKNFLRMKINKNGALTSCAVPNACCVLCCDCLPGELEVFVLGIDKMPARWKQDPSWSGSSSHWRDQPSHLWPVPSRWVSADTRLDSVLGMDLEDVKRMSFTGAVPSTQGRTRVKLVDHFVLSKPAASE